MNYEDLRSSVLADNRKWREYESQVLSLFSQILKGFAERLNIKEKQVLFFIPPKKENRQDGRNAYAMFESLEFDDDSGWALMGTALDIYHDYNLPPISRYCFTFLIKKNNESLIFKGFHDGPEKIIENPIKPNQIDELYEHVFGEFLRKCNSSFDAWIKGEKQKIGFSANTIE